MRVLIPGPLRSYTEGASRVEGQGSTVDELLTSLDERFPGLRFRIIDEQGRVRKHIKIFVDREQQATLERALQGAEEIQIICALSGG